MYHVVHYLACFLLLCVVLVLLSNYLNRFRVISSVVQETNKNCTGSLFLTVFSPDQPGSTFCSTVIAPRKEIVLPEGPELSGQRLLLQSLPGFLIHQLFCFAFLERQFIISSEGLLYDKKALWTSGKEKYH